MHILVALPLVEFELKRWEKYLQHIPSSFLARQGLESIRDKKFHCQGGSIFAVKSVRNVPAMVRFIVAFQTISDYLDNLCDRGGVYSEQSFASLHESMLDVFDMKEMYEKDYYRDYPYSKDGNYLNRLVQNCWNESHKIKNVSFVRQELLYFTELYTKLQTYKHLSSDRRKKVLIDWFQEHRESYPDLYWWEFSAASGSTLLIFALLSLSQQEKNEATKEQLLKAYFPWICGLHILLDYLIDQEEDNEEHELNFVSFYQNSSELKKRLLFFVQKAFEEAAKLPDKEFHFTVIEGLLALYLSDEKVDKQNLIEVREELLSAGTVKANKFYKLCKTFRQWKVI